MHFLIFIYFHIHFAHLIKILIIFKQQIQLLSFVKKESENETSRNIYDFDDADDDDNEDVVLGRSGDDSNHDDDDDDDDDGDCEC